MQLINALFLGATLVATSIAQSSSRIAFTILPQSLQAGQPVTLHWGGGSNTTVTLTLQQGPIDNLQTVQLITGSATGDSYTWTPSTSLPNADNYAIKISQGEEVPNYTGMITLSGGSSSSGSSSSAASASPSASSSGSGAGIFGASTGSSPSGSPIPSANSTSPSVFTNATTTAAPIGTGASAAGSSAGTGIPMSRNTTMSQATLSSTSSSSTASSTSSSASSTTGGGASSTAGGTAPTSSPKGAAAGLAASSFALVLCAAFGVVALG